MTQQQSSNQQRKNLAIVPTPELCSVGLTTTCEERHTYKMKSIARGSNSRAEQPMNEAFPPASAAAAPEDDSDVEEEEPLANAIAAANANAGSENGSDALLQENASPLTAAQELKASRARETVELQRWAKRETLQLRTWRLILLLVMLSAGAMAAAGTYLYLKSTQDDESRHSVRMFGHV
jgi:hypothetical protein